eukprot:15279733-Alexandrium_andersonii.AAC.1
MRIPACALKVPDAERPIDDVRQSAEPTAAVSWACAVCRPAGGDETAALCALPAAPWAVPNVLRPPHKMSPQQFATSVPSLLSGYSLESHTHPSQSRRHL